MTIEELEKTISENIFTTQNFPELEIYVLLNDLCNPICKYLSSENQIRDDIKNDLKNNIDSFIKKYKNDDNCVFLRQEDLIHDKRGIYQIEENASFCPFKTIITKLNVNSKFELNEADKINGFLFKLINREKSLYIFSKVYEINMFNIKKNIIYAEENDFFKKFSKKLIKIETHIDMIFFEENIFTDKIKSLEKDFKYENHEKSIANNMMTNWKKQHLIEYDEVKFKNWINKHPSYIKKILAIKKSVIYNKPKKDLLSLIQQDSYYKDVISIKNDHIILQYETKFKSFLTMMNDERVFSSFSSTIYLSDDKQIQNK